MKGAFIIEVVEYHSALAVRERKAILLPRKCGGIAAFLCKIEASITGLIILTILWFD